MKKLITLTLCTAALYSSVAAATEHVENNNVAVSCIGLSEQIEQAEYYERTAINAMGKNSGVDILVPLGHFTTYVGAEEAQVLMQERLRLLTKMSAANCDANKHANSGNYIEISQK